MFGFGHDALAIVMEASRSGALRELFESEVVHRLLERGQSEVPSFYIQ